MGTCASRTTKQGKRSADRLPRSILEDAVEQLESIQTDTDGQSEHVHVKATQSGRFLLDTQVDPMSEESRREMEIILEDVPTAAAELHALTGAAKMGMRIQASNAPAFISLIIVDIKSARLADYKHPQMNMTCEDDKSKFLMHSGGTGKSGDDFTWSDARFVFVIVFSHAEMTFNVTEGGMTIAGGPGVASGSICVKDLAIGTSEFSLKLFRKSKAEPSGSVQLTVQYEHLRGTTDNGQRKAVDQITFDKRKLNGMRRIVSRISNVNHWMMSHDNVWMALESDHPALTHARTLKRQTSERAPNRTSSDRIPGAHHRTASAASESSVEDATVNTASTGKSSSSESTGTPFLDVLESNAASSMFQHTLVDTLSVRNADTDSVADLKLQVASIFALINDRVTELEEKVSTQQGEILSLEVQLENGKSQHPSLPYLSGRFGYGLGRPASRKEVLLFAKRAQRSSVLEEWPVLFLGKHTTTINGTLNKLPVPESMATTPGHYDVVAMLPNDNTFARGSLYVLKPGTQCVLFDMDGTITVGDQEVVAQFALNAVAASTEVGERMLTKAYDQKARSHSRTLVRLWAAKGYQPVYLSGRQGSFYNLTLQWLIKHHYPPGPIHLTRTHVPTLPVYASVGNFKVKYMEGLKSKGFELFAAYGNTGTDVRAYEAAGIPKERTFTVGQAAGYGGTVKIQNWTRHLSAVLEIPDASVPIPYVDLLWSALPEHHSNLKKKSAPEPNQMTNACGQLGYTQGAASMTESDIADTDDIFDGETNPCDINMGAEALDDFDIEGSADVGNERSVTAV